jgi:peptide deformylase
MTKDNIITLPNKHLREKSAKISPNEDVKALIAKMTEAALDWEDSRPHEISAALAAVQIDELQRVIIIRSDFEDKGNREFTALINPKIIKAEGELIEDFEGCLSVSGFYGQVPRYEKIRIKAFDEDGDEIRLKAEGFLARVIQHEIDHVEGIVFVDHIKDKKDAFFELDEKGELQPLDYEKHIAKNNILWD